MAISIKMLIISALVFLVTASNNAEASGQYDQFSHLFNTAQQIKASTDYNKKDLESLASTNNAEFVENWLEHVNEVLDTYSSNVITYFEQSTSSRSKNNFIGKLFDKDASKLNVKNIDDSLIQLTRKYLANPKSKPSNDEVYCEIDETRKLVAYKAFAILDATIQAILFGKNRLIFNKKINEWLVFTKYKVRNNVYNEKNEHTKLNIDKELEQLLVSRKNNDKNNEPTVQDLAEFVNLSPFLLGYISEICTEIVSIKESYFDKQSASSYKCQHGGQYLDDADKGIVDFCNRWQRALIKPN